MAPLKIVFAGTPEFAAHHLRALVDTGHNVVGAYSQPDRPKGRGKQLSSSPVKQVAQEHNIAVFQPKSLKEKAAQEEFFTLECDLMIVVAYGLILPQDILSAPTYGCINVHGSLLPQWRGAAPIQRAIEAGDTLSGVTIMQMDVGLDTGDMLLKATCPILENDTSASLHDKLCEIGPPALIETIKQISLDQLQPEVQDHNMSTYASKIEKQEALINWLEPADVITRKIRAFNPFPVAYTGINGNRLKIHQATQLVEHSLSSTKYSSAEAPPGKVLAADKHGIIVQCGQGQLNITSLQLPGKKAMDSAAFINGFEDLLKTDGGGYLTFSDPA